VICPYGRLQSALTDDHTLVIGYDWRARGAARQAGRMRRGRLRGVRPVREGVPDRHRHPPGPPDRVHRLRGVHRRLRRRDGPHGRPPGLIRYDSLAGLSGRATRWLRPRTSSTASCCWSARRWPPGASAASGPRSLNVTGWSARPTMSTARRPQPVPRAPGQQAPAEVALSCPCAGLPDRRQRAGSTPVVTSAPWARRSGPSSSRSRGRLPGARSRLRSSVSDPAGTFTSAGRWSSSARSPRSPRRERRPAWTRSPHGQLRRPHGQALRDPPGARPRVWWWFAAGRRICTSPWTAGSRSPPATPWPRCRWPTPAPEAMELRASAPRRPRSSPGWSRASTARACAGPWPARSCPCGGTGRRRHGRHGLPPVRAWRPIPPLARGRGTRPDAAHVDLASALRWLPWLGVLFFRGPRPAMGPAVGRNRSAPGGFARARGWLRGPIPAPRPPRPSASRRRCFPAAPVFPHRSRAALRLGAARGRVHARVRPRHRAASVAGPDPVRPRQKERIKPPRWNERIRVGLALTAAVAAWRLRGTLGFAGPDPSSLHMLLEEAPAGSAPAARSAACRHCGAPLATRAGGRRLLLQRVRLRPPARPRARAGRLLPDQGPGHGAGRRGGLRAQKTTRGSPRRRRRPRSGAAGRVPELMLDVQGVSCAGCVWLIERIFSRRPGPATSSSTRSWARRLRWNPGEFDAAGMGAPAPGVRLLLGPAGEGPRTWRARAGAAHRPVRGVRAQRDALRASGLFRDAPGLRVRGPLPAAVALFATLSVLVGRDVFHRPGRHALRAGAMHIDLPIAMGIAGAYARPCTAGSPGSSRFLTRISSRPFILLMLVGRWAQVSAVERNRRGSCASSRCRPDPARRRGEWRGSSSRPGRSCSSARARRCPWRPGWRTRPPRSPWPRSAARRSPGCSARASMSRRARSMPGPELDARLLRPPALGRSLLAQLWRPRSGIRGTPPARARSSGATWSASSPAAALAGAAGGSPPGRPVGAPGAVAIAVLVVSCPCAIGLALPLADEMATAVLRRQRRLCARERPVVEAGPRAKIIFDKTGTLTLESPVLLNPEALAALGPRKAALLCARPGQPPSDRPLPSRGGLAGAAGSALEGPWRRRSGSGVWLGPWSLGRAGWRDAGPPGTETVFANHRDGRCAVPFCRRGPPGAAAELADLSGGATASTS
jgi:hypothetical protein